MTESCCTAAGLIAAALDELDRIGEGDSVAAALLTAAIESLAAKQDSSSSGN